MTPIRLLIGRLRSDRLPAALIVLLVFVTSLAAAAAPRLFSLAADAGLRFEVAQAGAVERNLQLGRITRIDADEGQAMQPVQAVAASVEAALPDSVRRVIDGGATLAESVVYSALDRPPNRPGFVTLRFQGDLDGRVEIVEGRMPTGATRRVPAPDLPPASVPVPPDQESLVFEVALSTLTADQLEVGVGDAMDMVPDRDDPLVGAFGFPEPVRLEVVGLYEVTDPSADFWIGDRALHEPTLVPVGIDIVLVYATALLSPDAYPAAMELQWPMRYAFRYFVDPERLDAGMVEQLVTDLRAMESRYAAFASQPDETRTTLQTGLLELTRRYLGERRSSEAVLVTAAIGPAAVALAAVGVLALMAIERRRRALVLLRGRGASASHIVASHAVEGLLLTAAPAALGVMVATAVVDARPTAASSVGAGLVALGTVLVIAASTFSVALRPLRQLGREQPAPIGSSPRRLALEALAIGLAIGGVVLLRQRGLAGGSAAGELEGVDPFLAAVPALIGVAVGLVTVRVYPYPVRLAGWLAASGRGVVPALGLRRAERQGGVGRLPLVVLLLTVAIGTFSSTMVATLDRAQVREAWQVVGADHRITGTDQLIEDIQLSEVDGVTAVAGAHRGEAAIGRTGGGRATVLALDAPEYEAVTAGTPVVTDLPAGFAEPVGEGRPGTSEQPIPAIVSRRLAETSTTTFRVGTTFELGIEARFAAFEVVAIRERLASLTAEQAFIVVPREQLRAALRDRRLLTNTIFVRAPADAAGEIRQAIAAARSSATVESQQERLDALRRRPLVRAIEIGFTLALAMAVAYAALAVVVALAMAASARAGETAHLRTLGIGRAQVTAMTVIEHGPPVVVAMAGGVLLGVVVTWVAMPGLGLAAFTGATADPVLTVDVASLAALAAVLVAVVAVGVALAAWIQRRADPARAVREGIE